MKIVEIMPLTEGTWKLDKAQRDHAARLMKQYSAITPGMFVQLISWQGDVWAEIAKASMNWKDPAMNNVTIYRYENQGALRKRELIPLGLVRKFANRPQIKPKLDIIHGLTSYCVHGEVVEWGDGRNFVRDSHGNEIHPTKRPR